jgi:hypothetical protein
MFAGSFLDGDAKTWFTDYFKEANNIPLFMEDWTLFTDELQRNFSVEDELGAAESDVNRLTMSEKDHATYFTARFRAIVVNLQGAWSDRSLRNAYLQKLPSRLMAQFQTSGRRPPDDLEGLIKAVEEFDSAHWAGVDADKSSAPPLPTPTAIGKPPHNPLPRVRLRPLNLHLVQLLPPSPYPLPLNHLPLTTNSRTVS